MNLFSERTALIDTENAFKVGPYIAEVEKAKAPRIAIATRQRRGEEG